MKMPCGGCGRFTSGPNYKAGECFYCWSAACSAKYASYWDEGKKVRATVPVVESRPERSYDPPGNPYQRDHVFTFSPSVPVYPPNQVAPPPPTPRTVPLTCIHRGEENGEVLCPTCNGKVMVKTFACEIYGSCTLVKKVGETACCSGCKDFKGE